jgi:Ricin-type beta-trefoil lectin domain
MVSMGSGEDEGGKSGHGDARPAVPEAVVSESGGVGLMGAQGAAVVGSEPAGKSIEDAGGQSVSSTEVLAGLVKPGADAGEPDRVVATETEHPSGRDAHAVEGAGVASTVMAPPGEGGGRVEAGSPPTPRRLSKVMLAAAAIAGLILISVPFALSGLGRPASRGSTAVSGAVYSSGGGSSPGLVPSAETPTPMPSTATAALAPAPLPVLAPPARAAAPAPVPSAVAAPAPAPPAPAKAAPNTAPAPPQSWFLIENVGSQKCLAPQGSRSSTGTLLVLAYCNGADPTQRWTFASDGTVRTLGGQMCMDVTDSPHNGSLLEIASCNASRSGTQRFVLNNSNDLVEKQADLCTDAKDWGTSAGTLLQLWSCAGTNNQKWFKVPL